LNGKGSRGSGYSRKHTNPENDIRIRSQAESLPLRRDVVTLLRYVRDNKVVGTQSTGNLPLKAVREVTAHFVEPPVLDVTIADRTYKLRTEADVWPLYFLHILAEVGSLVSWGRARRWRLTEDGSTFLGLRAFNQVSFLFSVWWGRVNWLVADSTARAGDELPEGFQRRTLAVLRGYAVSETVSFTTFSDELVEKAELEWAAPDDDAPSMMFVHHSIERMVIDVMENFGVVDPKYRYREELPGFGTLSRLDSFQITTFGHVLLNSLRVIND
jgi:hypothetical protein